MKKRFPILMFVAGILWVCFIGCDNEKLPDEFLIEEDGIIKNAVSDINGNTYNAVKLGNQIWMAENLRATEYADGTAISEGSTYSDAVAYRYCPNGDANNVSTYGYLYNWKAVMRSSSSSSSNPSRVQGICPDGWHVPSDEEWTQLTDYVSNQSGYWCDENSENIAKALASTTGWSNSNGTCTIGYEPSANNTTGFDVQPVSAYYGNFGGYYGFGAYAGFWCATEYNSESAYIRSFDSKNAYVGRGYDIKSNGYSVRCVHD